MKVNDIKELQKIIALCRKTGVESIIVDGIQICLGTAPQVVRSNKRSQGILPIYTPGGITENIKIATDELTPEQLMFYSSGVQNPDFNQQS